jgi:hypothetical protein
MEDDATIVHLVISGDEMMMAGMGPRELGFEVKERGRGTELIRISYRKRTTRRER